MSKIKLPGLSDAELERLRAEAERLGLRIYGHVPLSPRLSKRGDAARAIRARQEKVARRSSADLIREERDAQ